jgi:hypothetical protein
MTIDDYNKARDLVAQIEGIQNEIYDLRDIISKDTSHWLMEVRPNTAYPLKTINHYGLLPEFLQAVLSKHIEELHKLQSELDKL